MNPNSYYLRGSINSGSKVLLATTQGGFLYFLTSDGTNFFFDPRNPLLLGSPSTPTSFTINETDTTVSFNIGNSTARLNVNPQTLYARVGTSATQLVPSTGDVNTPDLIVAGGEYQFDFNSAPVNFYGYIGTTGSTGSTGTTGINSVFANSIELDNNGNPMLQTIDSNIRVVPIKWYRDGNCSVIPGTIGEVIQDEATWVYSTMNPFVGYPTGFTIQNECNNNVFYDYCVDSETCGTNNCNGVCSNSNQTCTLNTNNNTFSCTNQNSSSWWWILWLVLGIILLILIIALIWYAVRGSSNTAYTVVDTTQSAGTVYTQQYIPEYATVEYGTF